MKWLAIIVGLIVFFTILAIEGTKELNQQEAACQTIGMHHFHMRDGSEVCLPSKRVPEGL